MCQEGGLSCPPSFISPGWKTLRGVGTPSPLGPPSSARKARRSLSAWKGAAPTRPCFSQDLAGSWPVGELMSDCPHRETGRDTHSFFSNLRTWDGVSRFGTDLAFSR